MLLSQYHLVRIASSNFISVSYHKFLFNLITSFKFNWCVILLRKTISRQRNPLIVFCRMMQVPVYSLCRPLLKQNSAKTYGTDSTDIFSDIPFHPVHGTLGFITIYQSINVKCFELPQCFTCMMILWFCAILRVFVLYSHYGYNISSKKLNAHQALESMNL